MTNFAAAIEKNRIALLRMVFCWLAMAYFVNARAERILPPRLAAWALDLISKAEKATGFLLIAVFYNSQQKKKRSPDFERAAHNLMRHNASITTGSLSIDGIIVRLKSLQQILLNLDRVVRQMAKSIAARVRVIAMQLAALSVAQPRVHAATYDVALPDDTVPP